MNTITLDFGGDDSVAPTIMIENDGSHLCVGIGDNRDEISYWLSLAQANELMQILMVALPMIEDGAS